MAHIPVVEDSWIHEDLLRDTPVWEAFSFLETAGGDGPFYASAPLPDLLEYWRVVEQSTLAYLPRLTLQELQRTVVVSSKSGE